MVSLKARFFGLGPKEKKEEKRIRGGSWRFGSIEGLICPIFQKRHLVPSKNSLLSIKDFIADLEY